MVTERIKATSDAEHYKKKRLEEEASIKDAEQVVATTQTELSVGVNHFLHAPSFTYPVNKEWTKTAREMAPKEFKDPRASKDVGRKLESAKAALKKQESKQGASVEEITAELTRAKKAYDTARNEVKTMVALNKVRFACLLWRLAYFVDWDERWHDRRCTDTLALRPFIGDL